MKGGQTVDHNQSIICNVKSCAHNAQGGCSLQSIQVNPCQNCTTGKREDESMCASYENTVT